MSLKHYKGWWRQVSGQRQRIMGLRFTTTWRCDSRCTTCSIWKLDNGKTPDLSVDEIDRFSKSKYLRNADYITLSGGEPTMREDLADVVTVLHRNIPHATVSMTTNGNNPGREEAFFRAVRKKAPDIRFGMVGLSLNGPPEVHDRTRGLKGSFERVMETYRRIKDLVPTRFSFTFCRDNVEYFDWVLRFARENGTSAYICWTVMNQRFRVEDDDLVFWKEGMDKVLRDYVDTNFSRYPNTVAGVVRNLVNVPEGLAFACLYDNIMNQRRMPCYAGSQIVHVAPDGTVFPCNFKLDEDRVMGHLRKESFDTIWERMPRRVLREIACAKCMYPNGLCGDSDIYPSLRHNPPAVMGWYLRKLWRRRPLVEAEAPKGGRSRDEKK